jgi:Rhodopirellula transposase DDE domain
VAPTDTAPAWKTELAAFAEQTGLAITVAHFPPGTSKFNKIEHRLFSHITMNWRGMPLTSHEVIVNSIAATATSTGLTVAAELDTSAYPAGIKIPDKQMDLLPLNRNHWHGDWNYTLRPEGFARIDDVPDPFDQPSPDLAWLAHPVITGMGAADFTGLTDRLLILHHAQREERLHHRRGARPRLVGDGTTGRRPILTLPDRLLAAMLHHRLALPQTAIAALFRVTPETVNRRLRDVRRLLEQDQTTLQPARTKLLNLDDLHRYAEQTGIANPTEIKPAC